MRKITLLNGMLCTYRLGPEGSPSAFAPRVEVTPLTTNSDFERHCVEAGGLCIISTLDPTSPAHDTQLDAVKNAATAFAGNSALHFMVVDGSAQQSFLQQLGLTNGALPSAVILSPKKMRSAQLPGSFSAQGLQQFVEGVLAGKQHTQPLQVCLHATSIM